MLPEIYSFSFHYPTENQSGKNDEPDFNHSTPNTKDKHENKTYATTRNHCHVMCMDVQAPTRDEKIKIIFVLLL